MILNTLVCYLFVFLFMRSLLHAKLICVYFTDITLPQCGVSFFSESLAHCPLTSQSLLQAGCLTLAIQEEKLVGQVGPIPVMSRNPGMGQTALLPSRKLLVYLPFWAPTSNIRVGQGPVCPSST